jgi:dTDP-4-dehydrorhamnose 3,5-epimerase
MEIKVVETPIKDLVVLEIGVFEDARGFFTEPWNKRDFQKAGLELEFVQEAHSKSTQGVLRGLHYQNQTAPVGKLVRCIVGEIFDVAVDIRSNSPTYGKWFSIELSAENRKQLYIPPGFAHGFEAISEKAEVLYKQTGYYTPSTEGILVWSDEDLAIQWPISNPLLSDKDRVGNTFKRYKENPAF